MTEQSHSRRLLGRMLHPVWLWRMLERLKPNWNILEIGIALVGGLGVGVLLVIANSLSSKWQGLILLIVPGFALVMLIRDLKRLILAMFFLAVPINLDVSVVLSSLPENYVALRELRVSLVTIILVVGYALWIIEKPWEAHYSRIRFFPAHSWPALGVLLTMFISMWNAVDRQLSWFQIIQYIELFLAYFYVVNHVRNTEDMSFVIRIILLGVLFESTLMILQWTTGLTFNFAGMDAAVYGSDYSDMQSRVAGTLDGPNGAGGYMGAHLALATAFIFAAKADWEKWFAAIVLGLGSVAIVGTFSRSAWAGLVVAIAIIIAIGAWRKWIHLEQVMIIVCTAVALVSILFVPISKRLTGDDHGSTDSRVELKTLAWQIVKAKPLVGIGTNNYTAVARYYITSRQNNMDLAVLSSQPVHNTYLLTWAERGIVGLIVYIIFLASIFRSLIPRLWSGGRFTSLVAAGLTGSFVTALMRMYGQHGVGRIVNLYFWLLMALVASLTTMPSQDIAETS
ncbi:MAG: O-antigen ligase family protein [Anaerolineae bacterium]|nr:O-antigen ligase family protein [Anaerolineae bacterium]